MTAACNIVIERQNRLNEDDGSIEIMSEQSACIEALKTWRKPDAVYLEELRMMLGLGIPSTTPAPLSGRDGGLREAMPRLDDGMILAACEAHYGKRRVDENGGIRGISMTVDGADYDFQQAFRRMWAGVRKELKSRAALAAVPPETAEMEREPVLLREMYTDSEWALLQECDAADRLAARASSSGEAGDE